jgi:hypothetical protein
MSDDRLDEVLKTVDPEKRGFIRKLVVGAAFVVPTVASFAVSDLAYAHIGSGVSVTTTTLGTVTETLTVTGTTTATETLTGTVTITTTAVID